MGYLIICDLEFAGEEIKFVLGRQVPLNST